MNERIAFLREALEPTGQADVDATAAEPFDWIANTLYTYLMPATVHEPLESGPSVLERFVARVVYVADDAGEAAGRVRLSDVSDALDAKRTAYLDIIRGLMAAPPFWDFVTAREVPAPATLSTRAVSLQLTGYRVLSS